MMFEDLQILVYGLSTTVSLKNINLLCFVFLENCLQSIPKRFNFVKTSTILDQVINSLPYTWHSVLCHPGFLIYETHIVIKNLCY